MFVVEQRSILAACYPRTFTYANRCNRRGSLVECFKPTDNLKVVLHSPHVCVITCIYN